MKSQIPHQVLQKKINDLLYEIEHQYPELYRDLDEDVIKYVPASDNKIDTAQLCEYLDYLHEKLSHYQEYHTS